MVCVCRRAWRREAGILTRVRVHVFICVQEQAAHGDKEEGFGFEVAVRGCARHEVCRAFLATLQLANDGNVEIGLVVLLPPLPLPPIHPETETGR